MEHESVHYNADGLEGTWHPFPRIYINPPYSNPGAWCEKACDYPNHQILMLLPIATGTQYWEKWVWPRAACIGFVSHPRLKFAVEGEFEKSSKGVETSAKGDSALVFYNSLGSNARNFKRVFQRRCAHIIDFTEGLR